MARRCTKKKKRKIIGMPFHGNHAFDEANNKVSIIN